MRLLLFIFNVVLGASLLGLATDTNAADRLKKIKPHPIGSHKAVVHRQSNHWKSIFTLRQPKPAHRTNDVWERIRVGMQLYSLTDKFIFQTKAKITLEAVPVDITSLLKSSAVQVRLYKFQRYNIAALKTILKHPKLPIIDQAAEWHTAQNTHTPSLLAVTTKTKRKGITPLTVARCNEEIPVAISPIKVMPATPVLQVGFMHASFKQAVEYAPLSMPTLALPTEKLALKAPKPVCVTSAIPSIPATKAKPPRLTPVNYSLKAPNPLEQQSVYARVNQQVAWFAKRPAYLQLVAERARPYLYHIVEELSRHKLPLELALLPIVESAYKPTALSPMSAAGLWQFIPSTGRDFNLKQNGEYDERLDVTASTQAAIRFLSRLNKHFKGDWLLALAAYNCGQGNVDGAIRRNIAKGLPTDYWSLTLPAETQNYVPRLLALANIFANPSQYQLHVKPVKNEPYFVKVNYDGQAEMSQLIHKDLKIVAAMANMSYEQFNRLNPGYLNKTLTGQGPFRFILPIANANLLQQSLYRMASAEPDLQTVSPLLSVKFTPRVDSSTAAIVENVL